MKSLSLLLIGLFVASSAISAEPSESPSDRKQRAEAMTKDRYAYAASADYNPYDSNVLDIKKQALELVDKSSFQEAIAEADRGLKKDRYNVELLIAKAAALRAKGDVRQADEARAQWRAVVDSILASGDGKSFATAFRVITVDEEYAIIRILHLKEVKQRLVSHDGSQFDILVVRPQQLDHDIDVYFNIDLPKSWLDRSFLSAPGNKPAGSPRSGK